MSVHRQHVTTTLLLCYILLDAICMSRLHISSTIQQLESGPSKHAKCIMILCINALSPPCCHNHCSSCITHVTETLRIHSTASLRATMPPRQKQYISHTVHKVSCFPVIHFMCQSSMPFDCLKMNRFAHCTGTNDVLCSLKHCLSRSARSASSISVVSGVVVL